MIFYAYDCSSPDCHQSSEPRQNAQIINLQYLEQRVNNIAHNFEINDRLVNNYDTPISRPGTSERWFKKLQAFQLKLVFKIKQKTFRSRPYVICSVIGVIGIQPTPIRDKELELPRQTQVIPAQLISTPTYIIFQRYVQHEISPHTILTAPLYLWSEPDETTSFLDLPLDELDDIDYIYLLLSEGNMPLQQ